MEKQAELIKEANQEYIDGLNDALNTEKKLYEQQQSISDREQLQRQLSLLRRSGGSASEIYSLEQQLDDMLKDEYFNNQEKMIENIQEANEEQIRKLDEQIKIQQETLDFQKENGVLWTKVYDVMSGSTESIMAFMQGHNTEFFSQSALKQEEMLTEWSKKVGIYTADRERENHMATAQERWDSGNVWSENLAQYQEIFNGLTAEQQSTLQTLYNQTYANAIMEGSTVEEATLAAEEAISGTLKTAYNAQNAENDDEDGNGSQQQQQNKKEYWGFEYNGQLLRWEGELNARNGYNKRLEEEKKKIRENSRIWQDWVIQRKAAGQDVGPKSWEAYVEAQALSKFGTLRKIGSYSTGGLVDYTGIAMVHGSKTKPEAFLNAEQTAQIRKALELSGRESVLNKMVTALETFQATVGGIVTSVGNSSKSIQIEPNAINISVGQLANGYDVEDLSNDIMDRIVSIASKASGRGVNRR